jgi:hypothetical protein
MSIDIALAKSKWYFSDGFKAYGCLWYHYGRYEVSEGKNDTYSVEGDISELRHYLARLARRSRCFSRCPYALQCALKLFVFAFNRRQLHKQTFPNYQAPSKISFTHDLDTPVGYVKYGIFFE